MAMKRYLKTKYNKVYATKDYIFAVGDIPVALVAHLDTVFSAPPKEIYYDRVKNVMWSPDGLGADDRAGVYSIIQLVKSGLRPSVIFTTDEERGALGADALIAKFPKCPVDLKYIIELDRRGSDDCVFYSCDNAKFEEYVEPFGFVMNWGTFSDISVICPAWGIAGVNLSIGYYNEHSAVETLHIGQMLNTIRKVKNMLLAANEAPSFEYIEMNYSTRWFRRLGPTEDDYDDDFCGWSPAYGVSKEDWMKFMEPQSKCAHCGKYDYDYNQFPTKGENGETVFFCADCITATENIHWCAVCGEPFIDSAMKKNVRMPKCKDCRGITNAGN